VACGPSARHDVNPTLTIYLHYEPLPLQVTNPHRNAILTMSSDESTPNTIKRRLRSAGKEYAEHTLETAKDAVKGLENTHAAYLYPLKVHNRLKLSPFDKSED